jgi:hypothetical protein
VNKQDKLTWIKTKLLLQSFAKAFVFAHLSASFFLTQNHFPLSLELCHSITNFRPDLTAAKIRHS